MKFRIEDAPKIKLIIWDLDETFWKGTLSDFDSKIEPIQMNIELVERLAKRGVISSVCSKNDRTVAEERLKELGVLETFVFNSINWETKGQRIKSIINDMALRPVNVLFIDDNLMNLAEAEFVLPEIMVAEPSIIPELFKIIDSLGKDDDKLTRLNQYKVLERKRADSESFETNTDFLKSSNIRIKISPLDNEAIPRVVELIQRSNQLNFTKKRVGEKEVISLIGDENISSGYINAVDNYGEYGIVGFYALNKKKNELEHFLFSCRTMGMGIEQYVYASLHYPELHVVQPVSGEVSKENGKPDYITEVNSFEQLNDKNKTDTKKSKLKILLKGPCDLEVMASYLEAGNEFIDKEFNFVDSEGNQADYFNHMINILSSGKEYVDNWCKQYSFLSEEGFKTKIFSGDYDVVCLSPLMDATLAVYGDANGNNLAFGLYSKPLTDEKNHDLYINKKIMTARSSFKKDELIAFSKEFHNVEYTPDMIGDNIMKVINLIHQNNSNTKIIIILLAELEYKSTDSNYLESFADKHVIHKKINSVIKDRVANEPNIYLLDVNKYISKQADYFDNINHYSKKVYYEMAQEFVGFISELGDAGLGTSSKVKVLYQNMKRNIYKRLFVK